MSTVSRRSAGRLGQAVEPGAQVGLHVELARRLDQQAPAVPAAHDGERRLGRAQHLDALRRRGVAGDVAGEELGQLLVARRDDQRRQPAVGRQQRGLALADLARQERLAVAGDDRLHHRVLGHVGLHQAAAGG